VAGIVAGDERPRTVSLNEEGRQMCGDAQTYIALNVS
jgi:hypothetical protein